MPWNKNEKSKVAAKAGIPINSFSDIICRRAQAGYVLAMKLQEASREVLGEKRMIPFEAFIFAKSTLNSYFNGEPTETIKAEELKKLKRGD